MTKTQLAKRIGVDIKTLSNWEKNRTELVKLINLGLMAEEIIKIQKEYAKRLEEIEEKANSGKLQIK